MTRLEGTHMTGRTELPDLAAAYVKSRAKAKRPVSTADGIRAIRAAMPHCKLNDQQIANLLAKAAIRVRQPVIFDGEKA